MEYKDKTKCFYLKHFVEYFFKYFLKGGIKAIFRPKYAIFRIFCCGQIYGIPGKCKTIILNLGILIFETSVPYGKYDHPTVMLRKITFLLLLLQVFRANAQTRQDYAVFFPVTDYKGGWQPLPKTLPECQAIANDLETIYSFNQPDVLNNQTKKQIKEKLRALANQKYGPQDQLLLFFSMHGYFDEAGDAGCLVPYGGITDDPSFDTWLLHTELRALVTKIPCDHILIVLDACYSGTFGGAKSKPVNPPGNDCNTKIANALSSKSRLYLTAGGKEKCRRNPILPGAGAVRWAAAAAKTDCCRLPNCNST